MKRSRMAAAMTVLWVACVACGSGSSPGDAAGSGNTPPAPPEPARTADAVVRAAAAVEAARTSGAGDLARLSTPLVRVRSDGAVEVVLHAAATVTEAQLNEVRRLGADVISVSVTPAVGGQPPGGLVQLWIPAQQAGALDRLSWVAAVTPPSYGSAGG